MQAEKLSKNKFMQEKTEKELFWFVLKTIFSREMKVKELLDERNIENFIPMQYKIRIVKGKKEKVLVPAVNDLIFVHADKKTVEDFKQEILTKFTYNAYFLTCKVGLKRKIETVPEKQMREFIKVASHLDDDITFYKPEEIELKKGTKVRVIGGVYDGIEGVLLKIKGKKSKRIVIEIPGVAIAASYVEPELIEIIKEEQ